MHYFKLFNRVKSIQNEKVIRFIKKNKLKLIQVELLSFFHFKSVDMKSSFMYLRLFEKIIFIYLLNFR